MRGRSSRLKGGSSGRVRRYAWSVLSVEAARRTKRRWSLRTVMTALYFSFVIVPIALLAAVLGALLAVLLAFGEYLRATSPPSMPQVLPVPPSLSVLEYSESGTSIQSPEDGDGIQKSVAW